MRVVLTRRFTTWLTLPVAALLAASCTDSPDPVSVSEPRKPVLHGSGPNGEHSHWRSGQLTYVPTGGRTVRFTYTASFRRDGYGGSASDGLAAPGDTITEYIGATGLDFGDGGFTSTLDFLVTSVDVANNFLVGVALDPDTRTPGVMHTYDADGSYNADSYSCCRIGSVRNGTNGYGVQATVLIGDGNRSPVSSLQPIVNVPDTGTSTFTVPAADVDGDAVRFRLGTPAEAGSPGGDQISTLEINNTTGVATVNTTGLTAGLYWAHVIVEELDSGGDVKGQIAIDFLINVGGADDDGDPPTFTAPFCGVAQTGTVGTTQTYTITASDPDAGSTVTIIAIGVPPGATFTGGASGNPSTATFTFTPTATQVGPNIITFTATDDGGAQTNCVLEINVTTDGGPTVCTPNSRPSLTLVGAFSRIAVEQFAPGIPVAEMLRFRFRDLNCGPWRAHIEWGDGEESDFPISETLGPGLYNTFHLYATAGTYTIQMTVTDNDGDPDEGLTSTQRSIPIEVIIP